VQLSAILITQRNSGVDASICFVMALAGAMSVVDIQVGRIGKKNGHFTCRLS